MAAFKKAYAQFWPHPEGPLDDKSELGNIITPTAQARLQKVLDGTKGKIVTGGKSKGKRIAPAIVQGVKADDILLEEWVRHRYNYSRCTD